MKVARMSFDRQVLMGNGGLSTDLFKQVMDHLPKGTSIVGFGHDMSSMVDYVFVENDSFIDQPTGGLPPDIIVFFSRNFGGDVTCSGVDCSYAMPIGSQSVTIKIPDPGAPSYKVYGHGAGSVCRHEWETTTLFNLPEESCKHCGVKKP